MIKKVFDNSKFICSESRFLVDIHSVFNIIFCAASHGTGHQLLKVGSKRRRTQAEIKDDKFEEEMRDENLTDAINKAHRLERELMVSKQQARENENMAAWLQKFIQKG